MNNKKWKQYLNEECGCGAPLARKTQTSPSREPINAFRKSVNSLPMVVDPYEDVPLEDEDEHEHEGAHEHMPEDDMPTLQMTPREEGAPSVDESPYPENMEELVAMIADLLSDFLKHEGDEEHDCDGAHPEESHEHWRIKNLLSKGSSPCG
jgi:hypothetical protein